MFSLVSRFPALSRGIALYLAIQFLFSTFLPSAVYALTEGPSQPEVQSFEPMGATEMVDLFSGDFTYNIPLFELPGPHGGYPFNMAYHAGIGMDQEASWVGLGWNLNPGAISRNMRGLPDDFKGDKIEKEEKMKDNFTLTTGVSAPSIEVAGYNFLKTLKALNMSLDVTFNNYKGVGANLALGTSFKLGSIKTKGLGAGLRLSLNSQSGATIIPSLSLSSKSEKYSQEFTFGTPINSRLGLTGLTLGGSFGSNDRLGRRKNKNAFLRANTIAQSSAVLSLVGGSYMPSIGMPMTGGSLNVSFNLGVSPTTTHIHLPLRAQIDYEVMGGKQTIPAYGYLNLQESHEEEDLTDTNREKDGVLMKSTEFLCNPSLNYDIYSVNGQGMSAMYRPFRRDIGVVGDRYVSTILAGASLGTEFGVGPFNLRYGGDFTVNFHKSYSTKEENKTTLGFKGFKTNDLFEPVYFKVYGESSTDKKNLEDLLDNKPMKLSISQQQFIADEASINTSTIALNQERESRNTVVQPLTNKQVHGITGGLGEYKINYTENGTIKELNRSLVKEHHTAGFTVTNPDGLRYVYALPAYNKKQIETQFSTDANGVLNLIENPAKNGATFSHSHNDTDRYLSRTELPAYAHSYLLTAILGSDYIDADYVPGPSDGDIGYWVKFEYELASDDYKWRAPFYGANFNRGLLNNKGDNKGSYLYGEKQIWYLKTAETQSHIAIFKTTDRLDSRGAFGENQIKGDGVNGVFGRYSKKLDKIDLYSKPEYATKSLGLIPKPIVTAHFEYSYALCRNVANNAKTNIFGTNSSTNYTESGKLTLKKVYFTYQNNNRGKLSPYKFDYHEDLTKTVGGKTIYPENPDYDGYAYDRWGNYQPYGSDKEQNINFPYTNQKPTQFNPNRDVYAGVWSLKEITLPSGGTITVDYESDDYAYVHDKTAMKMTTITGVEKRGFKYIKAKALPDDPNTRRIYFDLDKPIPDNSNAQTEVEKYIKKGEQLFFKAKINLKSPFDNKWEWISGYAKVEDVGLDGLTGGSYEQGYVIVQKTKDYHPFCVAAWQHLQQIQPEIIRPGLTTGGIDDVWDAIAAIPDIVLSLANAITTIEELFGGFYAYCARHNYGSEIDLQNSQIRLNVVNKIKYGGGLRVKQVILHDNWQATPTDQTQKGIYGQVYEYTKDEDGKTISSGVAAYEPMIGGEEIPLRQVHWYDQELILANDPTYFFEGPINEGLYPGASVGYSEVTVRSLATAAKEDKLKSTNNFIDKYFPDADKVDFSTTGIAVHEFYTTKDFPIYSRHTNVDKHVSPLLLKALSLFGWSDDYMHATQGYVTELNDMHGKPKKVSYFAQETVGGVTKKSATAVSWVQYNYKSKTNIDGNAGRGQQKANVLNSEVDVLVSDDGNQAVTEKRNLGVDYELFVDDREHFSYGASNLGVEVNVDFTIIPPFIIVPIPYVLPALPPQIERQKVTTKVTNKIIHRTGILESVEAFDGTSVVKTNNLLWDAQTGEVVLTSVDNNFDDKIYTYTIPAHLKYDKMGAAYKNTGLLLTDKSVSGLLNKGILLETAPDNGLKLTYDNGIAKGFALDNLQEGDELIVFANKSNNVTTNDEMLAPLTMATVGKIDKTSGEIIVYLPINNSSSLVGKKVWLYVYRSGRRNMLSAKVGHITALTNPVTDRKTPIDCDKTFVVPIDCGN